jgi:hypothetical protein
MKAFTKRGYDADFEKGTIFQNQLKFTTMKRKEISSQKKF